MVASQSSEIYDIDQDDGLQDLGLPVSVQTYLWRQIAPFVRPKLGKLHEASCMSFEKVLVQNIQFGLSPPLTKALAAIPRWRLLQAALPHVMHCVSSLLYNRVKDLQAIGAVETKLLYTMHWILLYASAECADEEEFDQISKKNRRKTEKYLFSIPTITLFVYLFAPIIHHLKESDFQNFRLENGLKLWQGMWENRAPGAPCFVAPVKPKARSLLSPSSPKNPLDIFEARKLSTACDAVLSPKPDSPKSNSYSDVSKHDEDGSWVSSPKDFAFPETIPEEASSIEEERVVIFRLPSAPHHTDASYYTADASLLQQSHTHRNSRKSKDKLEKQTTKFDFENISKEPKTSSSTEKESNTSEKSPEQAVVDVSAATFSDVAVLRCLFITHWQEDGVFWSLQYVYNRLTEIGEDAAIPTHQPRKRSNSLPIPQIEISLYQGPGTSRDSPSGSSATKDYIEVPEAVISALTGTEDTGSNVERRGSEKKKRVKMADLKTFVETKMFSKSEKNLEKIGLDSGNGKRTLHHADYHRSLDTGENKLSRSASMISREPSSNLIKGKSMPSLRYVEPQKIIRPSQSSGPRTSFFTRNPIITVTEHTPTPSPDFLKRQGSIDSQLDALSNGGSLSGVAGFRSHMLRSHTDSHIDYTGTDESEVPGSSFYINRDGSIDYEIVLLAVFNVFKRDFNIVSLRVLEAGLNICEVLLELGVMKLGEHAHEISMGIIKRALLHLGCPHGCNDGIRGPPADFLRSQCQKILSRLLRQAAHRTKAYLQKMVKNLQLHELVEFFHAFVAFCVDPSSLLSPLNHKRSSGFKNANADLGGISSSGGQGGYATNFSGGLTGGAESQVIATVFKPLVSRFVEAQKELKAPENAALYCDVRQLMTYVKGAHGGPYRRVALSGILAVTSRPHKKGPVMQTTRVIRHIPQTDAVQTSSIQTEDNRSQRKMLLKKRSTSSACAVSLLETDACEDHYKSSQSPLTTIRRRATTIRPTLTPRHSERALLSDSTSSSERNSFGRLSGLVRWFRGTSKEPPSADLEIGSLNPDLNSTFIRHASLKIQRGRSSDGLGRSLQRARRRVERRLNRFGIVKGKKKPGSAEETADVSRRSSSDLCEGPRESEVVVLKERKLVPCDPIQQGMLRFSFLLETCAPGSFPDPQLVVAVLDLPQAPLIARAAFLIECSYFVHLCNKGMWPSWMKQNIANYRPSAPNMHARPLSSGNRRTHILQRAAGKMFHQWAELLGARLEELLFTERMNFESANPGLNDPDKQRDLLQQDEEEDFLDESCVNPRGNDCPHALKLIACVLLYEITSFLRDTYQTLPKASKLLHKDKPAPWEKVYREANRRWSMALSSMGHSQTSAQSLQSIAGNETGAPTERKISFVLHEPDNESENSSNTTLTNQGDEGALRRPIAAVRPFFLRRGTTGAATGGSFKRRSLKLRRGTKDGKDLEADFLVKRVDSIQSRRKVSSLSDRSDTSEPGIISGGEESPGILSDDQQPESPTDSNEADDTAKNMPWMKAVIELMNNYNFYCKHKGYCHPYCYKRHMRAASRLMKAVRKVYGEELAFSFDVEQHQSTESSSTAKQSARPRPTRKVSEQSSTQTSPSKRKDSIPRKDRINEDLDIEMAAKLARALHSEKEKIKEKDPSPVFKFVKNYIRGLFHFPMSILLKGAVILTEDLVIDVLPVAWELLLEHNQETAAVAASLFLMGSVKAQNSAFDIMQRSLKSKDPDVRIGAILRFQVLWKSRFQVWPRMEDGAHDVTFKVPPGGIEFTLPSPKIGIESLPVVDPPWTPVQQTKDMDVTLNQDRHRSLVTATKSRKMQQTEAIRNAIRQQREKKRDERHSFLITTIPINQQASHEPGLDHAPGEDHAEGEEETEGARVAPHLHAAHSLFPSVLCSSVVQIVACLDDAAIGSDGNAVYEVAYQVIWICLVEESALFLRYVLERLTRERQDQMFKLLRHLIRFVPRLPQQAAFALYNSIIGYIMFYVRSSNEHKQELVGSALSVLWMVVHSVHGIMFKDLKQILRKEQCDASILLTANVPAAKKIVVHGPFEDDGNIPSQFPVQEDTLFAQLLKEALDFYPVDEKTYHHYVLVDYKSNKILNPNWYIRDLYFFKRSQYPEVRLVPMKPEDSFLALQKQELGKKFVEIGKVHLTWAILKNVDMVVQRVVFLHEELMKLPSFPRKALEVDLDLHQGGEYGKALLGLDVLHKFMWVRLIARMFEAMAGNFAYSADIQLFLNVLSGAAILHAEDSCIMRYVMATYINAAFNFKNIFSTNGYFMIMPTLLQVYSLHQTNKLITTTIEYAVKQFYLLNRKPFILQMFGSVSAILDTDEEGTYGEAHKVQSSCLFNLLLSLEDPSPDPLNIAELVKEPKPLKAIDFCYHDEDGDVTVLDCITLCVMVVSYAAESTRGYQMLIILEAILPCYLQQIQSPSYIPLQGKSERDIILQLAVAIRTMVHNCEGLAKSYNGPYRNSPEHKGSSQRNCSRGPPCSPGLDFEEESHSKYVNDPRTKNLVDSAEDSEMIRTEYRRPRDVLLSVVGDFLSKASTRVQELSKKLPSDGKANEVLDVKCHIRLADIAHSLLKVSPYDPESMACRGLQRYMQAILPRAEWSNDALRNALVTILRRIDKVFLKISKKPSIRRNTDWEAASGLLKGIHETIVRHPYVLHWQHMKTLITTVQNLIINEPGTTPDGVSSAGAALMSQNPPAFFCSTVVRLVALQVVSPVDCFSLVQICGGSAEFATQEKAEGFLMHLLMPLCLKVCSGRGVLDIGELKQSDVSFLLTAVLNAMSPPAGRTGQAVAQINRTGGDLRAGSLTFTGSRDAKRPARISGSLYQAAFLALRIVCICFENRLSAEWPRIARVMRDLGRRNEAAPDLWSFMEFVVTNRTPLYIVLMPFILHKLAVAIRTMVHNCEGLAKSYNGPYRNSPEHKGSSQRNCSRGPPCSPGLDFEEESHSKYVNDPRTKNLVDSAEDSEMIRTEYRRPRDVLLSVVGDFLSKASTRVQELSKKLPSDGKANEVLDVKCHIRLADIAHSLLKVSPYDPESMACRGLQRYMQAILPRAEWSNDALRNALVTILRRIDKVFLKISKKPSIRRNTDWEAASGLLKGIHETIVRHPYVLHWQHMKTLITTVQNLIINEPGTTPDGVSSAGAALMSQNPPAFFCSTVVRLVALQVVSPVDCFSLVQICGGSAEFATQEKAEGFLMHLLMPLCLKVCSGRGVLDIGELKQSDVSFLLTAVLNAMSPPAGRTGQAVAQINRTGGDLRAGSLTFTGSRDAKRPARISGSLYQAAFLALRIVCICFENRLSAEWPRIARVMRDLGRRNEAAPDLWSFMEFVVTNRTPLYIVLMPFILHKISQPPIGDHERHMQFVIRERLRGTPPQGGIKSKGALLLELARELRDLRDELEEKRYGSVSDQTNSDHTKRDTTAAASSLGDGQKSQQRPSLISIFTGATGPASHSHVSVIPVDSRSGSGGICTPSDTLSQQTLHPPRESLSSGSTGTNREHITSDSHSGENTGSAPVLGQAAAGQSSSSTMIAAIPSGLAAHLSHSQSLQQAPFKAQAPKLRFVTSVEFKHSSGETSTTPLSPESPADDSSGEIQRTRLQRTKASSRKTFRLKRSRHPHPDPPHSTPLHYGDDRPKPLNETSWDSVSQTSSTSGYRENNSLQTGLLSPDGSLGCMTLGRSPSQHSLLMLFESQDEDTLI